MKYKPNQIIGLKKILKFVMLLGKKEWYKVECQGCGTQYTTCDYQIKKKTACRRCKSLQTPAAIPFNMRANKK